MWKFGKRGAWGGGEVEGGLKFLILVLGGIGILLKR